MVGNVLLISITLVLATGLSFGVSQLPPPLAEGSAKVAVELSAGRGGWATGDEEVVVSHLGGMALEPSSTTIRIRIGASTTGLSGDSLAGPFSDGRFQIGERWHWVSTISGAADVDVSVVRHGAGRGELLGFANVTPSGGADCGSDVTPPSVASWTQAPADVNSFTQGDVSVRVRLSDDCSGVDFLNPPRLWHRINWGGNPEFQDAGPLVSRGGDEWEGTIPVPHPESHWRPYTGSTLEYRLAGLQDYRGNAAESAVRADPINPSSALRYPDSPPWERRGTVVGYASLLDDGDGGQEARLMEGGAISANVALLHGTTSSGTSGVNHADARGAPNAIHATLPGDGSRVQVGGFPSHTDPITAVEIAWRGHFVGSRDNDVVRLRYRLGGAVTGSFLDVAPTSTDSTTYFSVTSDRAWTWSNIQSLGVEAEYRKVAAEDNLDVKVDALWVRVTTQRTTYALDVQANFTGVSAGSQHALELRYRTFQETFRVHVFQPGNGTWLPRGPVLGASAPANWPSYLLTGSEFNGGSPRIRFVDVDPGGTVSGELDIDYVRVNSS